MWCLYKQSKNKILQELGVGFFWPWVLKCPTSQSRVVSNLNVKQFPDVFNKLVHQFRKQHGVLRLPDIFTPYPGQKGSNLNPAVILSLFFSIIFQSTILDQIYCQIILINLHVLTTQLFNILLTQKPIIKWMNRSSRFERRKPKVRWLEVYQRRHHLKKCKLMKLY